MLMTKALQTTLAACVLASAAAAEDRPGQVDMRNSDGARVGVVDLDHPGCNQPGFAYDRRCCCTTGWCAPIPSARVRATPDGYEVILRERSDHPLLELDTRYVIPFEARGESPDGRHHLCGRLTVWCFLAPIGGV